jgi:lysozyme|tara:strand:+ start:162 stop:590 length:429 start_codon:yes stop_codon:yes gene_type:complete
MTDKIIEMLRLHEGVEQYVYTDHLGYETIGVGRCIRKNVGLGLSDDEINYLLSNDVDRCVKELGASFSWFSALNEARRDAMINLCFQLGLTKLLKFKNFLASMQEGDYEAASTHLLDSLYARQTPARADEVAEIIVSGKYQD